MNTDVTRALHFPAKRIQLPQLVFGATSLGNLFKSVSDQQKAEIVAAWMGTEQRPVVIDSAGKYGAGMSLEVIGRELAKLSVSAADVLISNKLGWRRAPLRGSEPTFEPGAWFDLQYDAVQDISYEGILRCWEEGNALLGNYVAQLASVHDPDEYLAGATDTATAEQRMHDIVDAYRALEELRDAGRVLATGVGAKDWRTIQRLSEQCDFDWVMLANSLTILQHPPELVEFITSLAQRGVTIINSAVFHGGFLLGGEFYNYRRIDVNNLGDQRLVNWRARFTDLCQQYDLSPFDAGVAFARSHPGVDSLALSSSRGDRVAEHVRCMQVEVPAAFWSKLRSEGLIDGDYPFV